MMITLANDYFGRISKGGSGSGNFGHGGRPGEVGGSGEGGSVPITGPHQTISFRGVKFVDVSESDPKVQTAFNRELLPDVTSSERAILDEYQVGDVANVNQALRTGSDKYSSQVKAIDSILNESRLPIAISVYRGFAGKEEMLTSMKSGDSFTDKGYASADTGKESALGITGAFEDPTGHTIAQILLPTGFPATNIGGPTASEILIARDIKYSYIGSHTHTDEWGGKLNVVMLLASEQKVHKASDRANYFTWQENDLKFIEKKIDKVLLVKFNPYHGEHGQFASADESGQLKPTYDPVKPKLVSSMDEYEMNSKWREQLTTGERGAIHDYTGVGYQDVNSFLRDGHTVFGATPRIKELMGEKIKLMDSALAKSQTDRDLVVYRGVSPALQDQMKEGSAFIDKAFVSTTLGKDISDRYVGSGLRMQISVPKGFQAGVIGRSDLSQHNDEREVLLPRSTAFHIDKVTSYTVYARVLTVHSDKLAKGGSGSGNFGHEGRPGERGGSSEGSSEKPVGRKWEDKVSATVKDKLNEILSAWTDPDQDDRELSSLINEIKTGQHSELSDGLRQVASEARLNLDNGTGSHDFYRVTIPQAWPISAERNFSSYSQTRSAALAFAAEAEKSEGKPPGTYTSTLSTVTVPTDRIVAYYRQSNAFIPREKEVIVSHQSFKVADFSLNKQDRSDYFTWLDSPFNKL